MIEEDHACAAVKPAFLTNAGSTVALSVAFRGVGIYQRPDGPECGPLGLSRVP